MSISCSVGTVDRVVRLLVAAGLAPAVAGGALAGWAAGRPSPSRASSP